MVSPAVVAVLNSNPDAIALLTAPLQEAGFIVIGASVADMRDRRADLELFLRTHRPHVIVFDVAPPYGLNWRLLERLREMPSAKDVRFVVTSVNPDRAEELSRGEHTIYEVIGKPYDLGRITDAVKDAARVARDERIASGLLPDAVADHRRGR
jgi:CheY-like chemotaxis protein